MSQFRVFLSAVTSEFGSARDALANDLQSHDVTVRVQRSFRHDGQAGTLLHKLRNYIEQCDAVIRLVGSRCGAGFPTPIEAKPFIGELPVGISEASYTQWELFFARHFGKQPLIYFATERFDRDQPDASPDDRPYLQTAFIAHLESLGLQRSDVRNVDDFRAAALRDLLRAPLPQAVSTQIKQTLGGIAKPILLPYPTLGSLFKGRDAFMARLRASLTRADGGAAAIASRAVHGMGGIGKTRAAVEYAWAHRDAYTALILLDAETPDKLQTALAALVGPLRLAAQATPNETERTEAALDWLNANPGWLLILDNIDTPLALEVAHRLLGRLGGGGHVVLTSRQANFPRGVERLDLDVLSLDDATAFLLEATPARRAAADDAAEARALAGDLGRLALALEMAAATIEARRLSLTAYRALWQGNRARAVGWARQEITGYHHAVAETWRTSVDQLTPEGSTLLERIAFLAPEPVPVSLLGVAVPGVSGGPDAHAALDDLATYSLATRDAEGETFLVHRLVQDVTRRGLVEAGTERQRLTEALGWVNAAFVGDAQDVRSWPVLDPLAPHAEVLAWQADHAAIAEPTARLMGALDMLFDAKAQHMRAETFSRRALAIDEAKLGADHPTVASRLNNLAVLLRATNRLAEAEPLIGRAVVIYLTFECQTGHTHPNRDTALAWYRHILTATGHDEAAIRAAIASAHREAGLG